MKYLLITLLFITSLMAAEKPNIILILTDDMGYSDLGCFGGEINTPNLDGLAMNGQRFTHFYNTGRCCPSRASLLTGKYSHTVGFGHMDSDKGKKYPGYVGHLTGKTIAEYLKDSGYYTFITGKWHLGSKVKEHWPTSKGFDDFYGVPQGGGFYFDPGNMYSPRQVVRGTEVVYDKNKTPPKGWYATDAFTDEGLNYVNKAVKNQKPFFWYVAYNAPHFPLQAKQEDIQKYRGKYKKTWDGFRKKRFDKQLKMGIMREGDKLSKIDSSIPSYDSLSKETKDLIDLRMATYAAMVDNVDQNVGKIISHLKAKNIFDNTLIIFLNDNGAASSGGVLGKDKANTECGTLGSFSYAGLAWANVSNTPFRLYKTKNHEGGITNPAIFHWPKGIKDSGHISHERIHLIDIAPTLLNLAGGSGDFHGLDITPKFSGGQISSRPLFFEHEGNCAVIKGEWKLVRINKKSWELYNIDKDRSETENLVAKYPEIVSTLSKEWKSWAKSNNVLPSPFIR